MSSRTIWVMILCIVFLFSCIFSNGTVSTSANPLVVSNIQSIMVNPYTFNEYIRKNEKMQTEDLTVENSVYSKENNEKIEGKTKEEKVTISFAGDCTIGWDETFSYNNSFPYIFEKEGKDYSYFFQKVKPIFENDDLTLVNLETTLTNCKRKAQKKFRFKGDPSYVNILTEGSIEIVNISNNHIYDYLQEGFDETIKTLEEGEILYCGEGNIAYYNVRGIIIASMGYRVWDTAIKDKLYKDIKKAEESADIVLVSFHWGQERRNYPNKAQIALGHFAIDQGADMVVGHHPHVIQGIEKYKGKYIVYSLGNFVFGGNKNPSDKDTFIFQGDFFMENKEIKKIDGRIIPCRISSQENMNNYQPIPSIEQERQRVFDRIYLYSKKLKYGISIDEMK